MGDNCSEEKIQSEALSAVAARSTNEVGVPMVVHVDYEGSGSMRKTQRKKENRVREQGAGKGFGMAHFYSTDKRQNMGMLQRIKRRKLFWRAFGMDYILFRLFMNLFELLREREDERKRRDAWNWKN